MTTRYIHLTNSSLSDIPESDFEYTWKINDATAKLDGLARSLYLGECTKTWVTGFCYYDYKNTNMELTKKNYEQGNRKVYLGVTRHYEILETSGYRDIPGSEWDNS